MSRPELCAACRAAIGGLPEARWRVFEHLATEFLDASCIEHWERVAAVYERWAVHAAEKNWPSRAKELHGVAMACRERVELVRRYPETFGDAAGLLEDLLLEPDLLPKPDLLPVSMRPLISDEGVAA